jgi:hypothetical protein
MNRLLRRAVTAAGVLAVTGGTALASAMPAGAVVFPRSWAAQATGTVSLSQVALAYPGNTPVAAFGVPTNPLLSTGFLLDRAGSTWSYSQVQSPSVAVNSALALVGASAVNSQCITGLTGSTQINHGQIVQYGQPTINLPLHPAANTTIQIPGGVTITLNKQDVGGGIRQVTAIYVAWSGQNVSVGVTRC